VGAWAAKPSSIDAAVEALAIAEEAARVLSTLGAGDREFRALLTTWVDNWKVGSAAVALAVRWSVLL
jgi:hypothetical protein